MIVLVIYVVSDVVFCNCVMSSYFQGNEILHQIFSTIKNTVLTTIWKIMVMTVKSKETIYVRVGKLSKHYDNTMIFDFDYLLFILWWLLSYNLGLCKDDIFK